MAAPTPSSGQSAGIPDAAAAPRSATRCRPSHANHAPSRIMQMPAGRMPPRRMAPLKSKAADPAPPPPVLAWGRGAACSGPRAMPYGTPFLLKRIS